MEGCVYKDTRFLNYSFKRFLFEPKLHRLDNVNALTINSICITFDGCDTLCSCVKLDELMTTFFEFFS